MQTCKCQLKLNDYHIGNKTNITPTEALILKRIHDKEAGGNCIINPVLTGDSVVEQRNMAGEVVSSRPITNKEEVRRLRLAYNVRARNGSPGTHILDDLYPGTDPTLPQTFEEVGVKVAEKAPEMKPVQHPESSSVHEYGEEGRVLTQAVHPLVAEHLKHADELFDELVTLENIPENELTKEQAKRLKQLSILRPPEPPQKEESAKPVE